MQVTEQKVLPPKIILSGYIVQIGEVKKITEKYIVCPFVLNYKSHSKVEQYRSLDAVGKGVMQLQELRIGDFVSATVELKGKRVTDGTTISGNSKGIRNNDEASFISKV